MAKNQNGLELILGGQSEDETIIRVLKECLPDNRDATELRRQIQLWRKEWNKQVANGRKSQTLYDVVLRSWSDNHQIIKTLIDKLGIWLPLKLYSKLPVVLPYVRRVPGVIGPPDRRAWPEPGSGICSDDNSQVKELKSLGRVRSRLNWYEGKIDKGYTVAHIWQKVLVGVDKKGILAENVHACNIPCLNTFVPNIYWLPEGVAKLTDQELSFAQGYSKLLAYNRYAGKGDFSIGLERYVDRIWDHLPDPRDLNAELPNDSDCAEFVISDQNIRRRIDNIKTVIKGLDDSLDPNIPDRKILRKHYTIQNIRDIVERRDVICLRDRLQNYYDLLNGDDSDADIVPVEPRIPPRVPRRITKEIAAEEKVMTKCIGETEIVFLPDRDAFWRGLTEKKFAQRVLEYDNGDREIGFWRIRTLDDNSRLMTNIQSTNYWRTRREKGLRRVTFSIP